ncbi:hypothetical protein [Stieleria magnilauensis]|uniref:Uncharacterized protein n=1 Tax=Stieleria magnilauensis TaxID=2527963 RepID=A0ABX5XUX2_9BACT|nr:hypothetical protein TBK1r_48460 [Planctomycetes bacterium TBK1r]
MNKTYFRHLAIFVAILIALNFLFQWHISIIGSLLLTIGLNFAFNLFSNRRSY